MGLLRFLLGLDDTPDPKPTAGTGTTSDSYETEYDDYYQDVYDDAVSGDADAIDEMEEEFGDDWEGEY